MLASRGGLGWTETRPLATHWKEYGAWQAFKRDWRGFREAGEKPRGITGKILRWFSYPWIVVYFLIRFLIGTILEVTGKTTMAAIFGVIWLGRQALVPVLRVAFGAIVYLPVKLTQKGLEALHDGYPRTLRWAIHSPLTMALIVVACFAATGWTVLSLDTELLPEVRQGEFTVEVQLPVGTPIEATESIVAPIEKAILEEKEHIESLLLTVGYDTAYSNRSDEGEHTARFKVLLDKADPRIEDQVIERLRARFAQIPDLEARVTRPVLFSFKAPVEVEVHSDDLILLRQQAERVKETMAAMPQLADVETTQQRGAPEVQVVYDRDLLSRYGLNLADVARLVRDKVQGFEATRFNLKDRRIPILVRLRMEDRETVEEVRSLIINPGQEKPIPLSAVASIELAEGPSEVRRIDGRRVALVTANIATGSMGSVVDGIRDELDALVWPPGSTFLIAGQNEEWERSQGSLYLALALSIFLVYVIMAAQFESLWHPLIILFTIPLAFFGTVITLDLLGISLSIVVFLGMIMLAGIVVNNAIVLVDYINILRRRGLDLMDAVVTAGSVRLRPILMTTATTTLGLLPMALGVGDGAELRTPMAIAVISGLVVSTLLTLFIIPSIYTQVSRLRTALGGEELVVVASSEKASFETS
jgi:HAE1 family hydrophobic/amphiphilic exporter-1